MTPSPITPELLAQIEQGLRLPQPGDVRRLLSDLPRLCAELRRAWQARDELEAEVLRLRHALHEYGEHGRRCLLSFWEGGEPDAVTGGYRMKYQGVWYPSTKLPLCTCGLEKALEASERR